MLKRDAVKDDMATTSGQKFAAAARVVWASFRALPVPWQGTVAVLVLLLLIATANGQPEPALDTAAASSVRADAVTVEADAEERIADLQSEMGQLRERLSMAEAELARSEARATAEPPVDQQLADQRERLTSSFHRRIGTVRQQLQTERSKTRNARQHAKDLRGQLAAAASVPEPVSEAALEEEPADAGCHSSYSGCVPIASDVDCAGGSGNGPEYTGYVEVIGPDEYDLDSDGDGTACES